MCGIVGMMASGLVSDKGLSLFKGMLYLDEVRGAHATGVVKVNPWKKAVSTHKRAIPATKFLADEEAIKFMETDRGRIYIGHNRFATHGDKAKDENAHPFVEGHITMVHNGGVDRWTMDKLEGFTDKDVVVDSHMVARTIASKGIEGTVPLLSGAFTLVWWNSEENTLNFIRNKERPLWLATLTDNTMIWASEREFMDAFVLRKKNGLTYKEEPTELPTDKLVTWKFSAHGVLENVKPSVKELTFNRVPDPKPPVVYSQRWNGNSGANFSTHNGNRTIPAWEMTANGLLRMAKCDKRVGEDLTFRVTELEPIINQPTKVNVHGTYDGLDVICFYMDKTRVEGSTRLKSKITNAIMQKYIHEGFQFEEPRIQVSSESLVRVLAANSTPNNVRKFVPTAKGTLFPLKTHGHTFMTREEFSEFVAQGCSICKEVPVSWDARNTSITVYETANFHGLLKDCEFVCGECVETTEPKKK